LLDNLVLTVPSKKWGDRAKRKKQQTSLHPANIPSLGLKEILEVGQGYGGY
jgi:hypothetical protein